MADHPFKDHLPAIYKTKVRSALTVEKEYKPWVINRALSYNIDTIHYANEMNKRWGVDKQMQFDYFLATIRPKYREFTKWWKPVDSEDLEMICEYYGYSKRKAIAALDILSSKQIEEIRKRVDVGGIKNG